MVSNKTLKKLMNALDEKKKLGLKPTKKKKVGLYKDFDWLYHKS